MHLTLVFIGLAVIFFVAWFENIHRAIQIAGKASPVGLFAGTIFGILALVSYFV